MPVRAGRRYTSDHIEKAEKSSTVTAPCAWYVDAANKGAAQEHFARNPVYYRRHEGLDLVAKKAAHGLQCKKDREGGFNFTLPSNMLRTRQALPPAGANAAGYRVPATCLLACGALQLLAACHSRRVKSAVLVEADRHAN